MKDERVKILGVGFDKITLSGAVKYLDSACDARKQVFCVTPNPEIVLAAQKDKEFLKILNSADLSIADGFGILWASRFLSGSRNAIRWLWTLLSPPLTRMLSKFPERVTGTDLLRKFFKKHKKRKVFLLGASEEVNNKLAKKLKKSGVRVVGNFSGDASEKLAPIIVSMINASEAEVLFVAFGAPRQEKWIKEHLKSLKTVRVAAGIGGAFDFMVGVRKRAPRWMRSFGLEWLYRLLIEPSRFMRIFRATVVFPWKVLISGKKPYN